MVVYIRIFREKRGFIGMYSLRIQKTWLWGLRFCTSRFSLRLEYLAVVYHAFPEDTRVPIAARREYTTRLDYMETSWAISTLRQSHLIDIFIRSSLQNVSVHSHNNHPAFRHDAA